jgi:hypothetical protein
MIHWRRNTIVKGVQLGFSRAMIEAAKARAKSSRRLRWPFGRAKRAESWIVTSQRVKSGALTEQMAMVATARETVDYNPLAVDTLLRMVRRVTTQANKRQGWRPDGSEVACG